MHLMTVLRLTELQLLGASSGFCRMQLCIYQGARCATFSGICCDLCFDLQSFKLF